MYKFFRGQCKCGSLASSVAWFGATLGAAPVRGGREARCRRRPREDGERGRAAAVEHEALHAAHLQRARERAAARAVLRDLRHREPGPLTKTPLTQPYQSVTSK